jgi:hypothetical protein
VRAALGSLRTCPSMLSSSRFGPHSANRTVVVQGPLRTGETENWYASVDERMLYGRGAADLRPQSAKQSLDLHYLSDLTTPQIGTPRSTNRNALHLPVDTTHSRQVAASYCIANKPCHIPLSASIGPRIEKAHTAVRAFLAPDDRSRMRSWGRVGVLGKPNKVSLV